MRTATAIALAIAFSGSASAELEHHDHLPTNQVLGVGEGSDPHIEILINPEARVSVTRTGDLSSGSCGSVVDVPVKIINEASVTALIEARLVGAVPPGIDLEFQAKPLNGAHEENRTLQITLRKPVVADITIAFRARNDIAELGSRDRVYFLLRCA